MSQTIAIGSGEQQFDGNSQHKRARSTWALQGPARHYEKILRPPSAAQLRGYHALKQENPGYFALQKGHMNGSSFLKAPKASAAGFKMQAQPPAAVAP